jgi:GTP-binding protein Era
MNREGEAALGASDAAILVVAAPRWAEGDSAMLARLAQSGLPVVLAVNKIDRVKPRDALLPILENFSRRHDFSAIVPISASKAVNLDALVKAVAGQLPEGPAEEARPAQERASVSRRPRRCANS